VYFSIYTEVQRDQALGDADTAALEPDAAAATFERLGAETDLRAVD
jgi:hypothetical protein